MEALATSKWKDEEWKQTSESAGYFAVLAALYEQGRSHGADYT
jgi:hypothetical protein